MFNPFDIDSLSYDMAIQLAVRICDGTPEDAVCKYFELWPEVHKQVAAKIDSIKTQWTIDRLAQPDTPVTPKPDTDGPDPRLREAAELSLDAGMASVSMIQRKMRVGYARAGKLVDQMEGLGIVSKEDGAKPRKVLIDRGELVELFDHLEYRESAIESFSESIDD